MPTQPEVDGEGNVLPHDDAALNRHSKLVRNINPQHHLVPDENIGGLRITSAAFSATSGDPSYGMSVDLVQLMEAAGAAETCKVPPGFGAVVVMVGDARDLALKVGPDPVPTNEFHGQVWGVTKKKRSTIHSIVKEWLVALPGVTIR